MFVIQSRKNVYMALNKFSMKMAYTLNLYITTFTSSNIQRTAFKWSVCFNVGGVSMYSYM